MSRQSWTIGVAIGVFGEQSFGIATTDNYDICLVGNTNPYTYIDLILADGKRIHFINSGGNYDTPYYCTATRGPWYGAKITYFVELTVEYAVPDITDFTVRATHREFQDGKSAVRELVYERD